MFRHFLLISLEEYRKKFAFLLLRHTSAPCAGNTVIHLDQALARMREYERMKTEVESNTNMRCTCKVIEDDSGAAAMTAVNHLEGVWLNPLTVKIIVLHVKS